MPGLSPWTVTVLSWTRSSCLSVLLSYVLKKNSPGAGRLLLQPFLGILTIFSREARPSLTFRPSWSSRSSLSPSLTCYHCIFCLGHFSCVLLGDPISTLPPVDICTCHSLCLQVPLLPSRVFLPFRPRPQESPASFPSIWSASVLVPSPCSVVFIETHSTYLKIHCFKL